MNIVDNVQRTRERIADACHAGGRRVDEIELIAVSKTQGPEVLGLLAENGLHSYGENRLDHAQLMHQACDNTQAVFHCIGRVQSRQLSQWVAICDYIHSLHKVSHVKKIAQACKQHSKKISVFCQVNTSGEASKAGIAVDEIIQMIDACAQYPQEIDLCGLMCMAPIREGSRDNNNDADILRCFSQLYDCAQTHHLPRLSMGMSGDFDLAVQAGATDLRIGSSLFVS